VVIQAAGTEDRQRLEAQLQVLDDLQRPQLLLGALADQLGPDARFEWIAGRHPWRQASSAERRQDLETLTTRAASGAELRLLFSAPLLGPAAALLRSGELERDLPLKEHLEPLARAEADWLASTPNPAQLSAELEQLGWQPEPQPQLWHETLDLTLSPALLQRWFQPGASYRQHLATQLNDGRIEALQRALGALEGRRLPQRLQHQLLVARRKPGAQAKAPAKPGRSRRQRSDQASDAA
jgi:putative ATPase